MKSHTRASVVAAALVAALVSATPAPAQSSAKKRPPPASRRDAVVFVDGSYVGLVDDFDGKTEFLNLTPGPHHLELRAPGFEPLTFDVSIEAGRTITYRTPLQPAGSPTTARP
jgi:hypothetical protein